MKILYCSIEPNNPVDAIELKRLEKNAEVTVLTTFSGEIDDPTLRVRYVVPRRLGRFMLKAWLKIATLVCKLPSSSIAARFPERNVYQRSKIIALISNLFWHARKMEFINKLLPSYSSLVYALPWDLTIRLNDQAILRSNAVIYNSLHIVSADFIPIIMFLKKKGVMTVANVRSWDNPYYIQFDTRADHYLVWSEFMSITIEKSQHLHLNRARHQSWGPNLIKRFADLCHQKYSVRKEAPDARSTREEFVIGYAAAFGDHDLAVAEYKFICCLSSGLRNVGVKSKIIYRPYPTVSTALLKASCQDDGVDICEIFSDPVDRYGDGREIIRFGSPEERHSFLESCSIFLSLGTTFTLEALVHGLDVLHLYIPPQSRSTSEEFSIFQRVEITCDHFFDYFTSKIEFIPTKEIFYKRVAELNNFICNQSQGLDRVGLDHLYDEITLPFTIMKS